MEVIRYAMIRNQVVENVSLWNGDTFVWQPPEGILCIPAPDHVGVGCRYIDGEWLDPIIPDPVPEPDPNAVNDSDVVTTDPASENLI